MKFGFRKPNLKKRFKARTTGKLKRKVKSLNPLYGKKGMGWVKNPKKAMYSKVYHKTTIDPLKMPKGHKSKNDYDIIYKFLCLFFGLFGLHKFYQGNVKWGLIYLFTIGLAGLGWLYDVIEML